MSIIVIDGTVSCRLIILSLCLVQSPRPSPSSTRRPQRATRPQHQNPRSSPVTYQSPAGSLSKLQLPAISRFLPMSSFRPPSRVWSTPSRPSSLLPLPPLPCPLSVRSQVTGNATVSSVKTPGGFPTLSWNSMSTRYCLRAYQERDNGLILAERS